MKARSELFMSRPRRRSPRAQVLSQEHAGALRDHGRAQCALNIHEKWGVEAALWEMR